VAHPEECEVGAEACAAKEETMEHLDFEMDTAPQASGDARAPNDAHKPVIVVDDSMDDRLQLKRELEHVLGPTPFLFFDSGTELVNYLDTHTRESEKPRIIFLDLMMSRMDGLTTLELLQDRLGLRATPVVAVSGTRSPIEVQRALESGAQAFLPKPVARWDMIKVLHGTAKPRPVT